MTRTKILMAASAMALSTALGSTPAAAQSSCDLDGAANAPPAGLGTDSFFCGDFQVGYGSGDDQTIVGFVADVGGDGATAVGSFAAADPGGGFGSSPLTLPTDPSATAVGAYAFAVGSGTVAIGDQAVAAIISPFLSGIQVSGVDNATAIGSHSQAIASNATAVGMSAQATADSATAIGQNATASGVADTATGVDSTASGGQSAAFGFEAEATGNHATALGAQATVSATDATAVGFGADATATGAVALGNQTTASHANSVAIGNGTSTTAANQVNVGGRTISGVNAGVAATDAVNVSQLNAAVAGVAVDLSGLEAMDEILAGRIGDVDDRSRSGTAVAIAMGGAAFLPDKRFNLTGNVGTYRGAWAGAMNFGAMVGSNAAINAGVGAGFNKKGKVGARVGFTLGF